MGPGGFHAARRSLTNLSELGAEKSPESAHRFRPPPESLEAQLSHKLQAGHALPSSLSGRWRRELREAELVPQDRKRICMTSQRQAVCTPATRAFPVTVRLMASLSAWHGPVRARAS